LPWAKKVALKWPGQLVEYTVSCHTLVYPISALLRSSKFVFDWTKTIICITVAISTAPLNSLKCHFNQVSSPHPPSSKNPKLCQFHFLLWTQLMELTRGSTLTMTATNDDNQLGEIRPGSDLRFWNSTHLKVFQLTFRLSRNLFFQLTSKFLWLTFRLRPNGPSLYSAHICPAAVERTNIAPFGW